MKKKQIAIITLLVVLIQIMLNVVIPINALAEDMVTIQCKDSVFYNKLVQELGSKVSSKNDTAMTVTMTKTNVDSVTRLMLTGVDGQHITNINGIENFKNLTLLSLIQNSMSDISPLSQLTNLQDLRLGFNSNITDISVLSRLTKLENLHLRYCRISNISALSELVNLKVLDLIGNEGLRDINPLKKMTNLEQLWISNNQIEDINALSRLTKLNTLILDENKISNISALTGLTNLEWLYLSKNQIDDASAISGLSKLTNYSMEDNEIVKNFSYTISEVELPQIIKAAKDSSSKIYTKDEYILTNCTLSSDKTKMILNNNVTTASIKINGGKANGTTFTVKVPDTIAPTLTVKSSTTAPTNGNVTVTITANEEIQPVAGWTLSSGKKILTKTYTANGSETVTVKDLAGNGTTVPVTVNNIDKTAPTATVAYSTTSATNGNVIATITSNEQIQGVTGWTLDSSKKILTKTYTANTSETVTVKDLAGNTLPVAVNIGNIDKTVPTATVAYSTTSLTNQNVTVTITANEQMQEVSGWTLDSSKKVLTKTYSANESETVTIKDLVGNSTSKTVSVANIDKTTPTATVAYNPSTATNENVTVTITANEEIQEVSGWTLDSSKKILTKTYNGNTTETITIKDIAGNTTTKQVTVSNIDKLVPTIEIKYSKTEPTNQNVEVTITANEEIQEVSGWTLDNSKKVLTKTYSENGNETITIKDLYGNSTQATITVNNIDKAEPTATVAYNTTTATNGNVTATITANEEIQEVSGWTLDSSKKILTKTYTANASETITIKDIAGNTMTKQIAINNIDKVLPEVTLNYSEINPTNKDVTVTISANKEIQGITGWTLSNDKKVLTKTYSTNTEETIEITDLAGNKIEAIIKVTNIDKTAPKIENKTEERTEDGKVIIKIEIDKEVDIPEGWILDEKTNTIYKEYDANTEETVEIKDKAGNITKVEVKVTGLGTKNNMQNNIANNTNGNTKDSTTANGILPQTGLGKTILTMIVIITILGIAGFIKTRKYKDIK